MVEAVCLSVCLSGGSRGGSSLGSDEPPFPALLITTTNIYIYILRFGVLVLLVCPLVLFVHPAIRDLLHKSYLCQRKRHIFLKIGAHFLNPPFLISGSAPVSACLSVVCLSCLSVCLSSLPTHDHPCYSTQWWAQIFLPWRRNGQRTAGHTPSLFYYSD